MAGAYSSAYSSAHDAGSGAATGTGIEPRILLFVEGQPYVEAAGLVISEDGVWPFEAVDAGAVTGTVAVTQAAQTSTAAGVVPHAGTSAQTQQNQTSTASGSVASSITGTVAVTQNNQTSTAQGTNAITGTSTASQANQTSTASGNVSIAVTGTVAVTQSNQTSTASGSMATGVTGSGTPTQQNQSSTTSASVLGGGFGAAEGAEAEQGHRFEAWTLPNTGDPFHRKFDLTRWVGYTFSHKWSAISDGRLDLPTDFPKLAQLMTVDKADHSNDIGSVIRVLIGTTPIIHYVLKGLDDRWSSEQQTLTGLLEGMDYYLDRARVPNFDAPASPSVEPDHIYGAPSILSNWNFENTGVSSASFQLSIDATAGTFTLTIGSEPTGPINWNPSGPDIIQTAVEALPSINDVAVSGAGTNENPFIVEVLSPANVDIGTLSTNSGSLTGLATVQTITVGGASLPDPWTRSQNPTNGLTHGTYNFFGTSTVQAHSGTTSLYIDGDLGNSPGSFPGGQTVVGVTGGRTYRFSVWVYPKFTARYRFVVRTADETFIGQIEADLTANSWQEMVIPAPVTIPAHIRSVIYRVACISNSHGVQQFYLDDATLAPGMPAATYGKVARDVLAPIQAEGVLTWVTPSFTATHDSAGITWDRTHEWAIRRGQTLLQFTEYADRYNYENGGIRWDVATNGFVWDLFNPLSGGADKENSGFAVVGKMISESGTLSKRIPDATFFHAEGDTGHWGTHEDATLTGAWGPLQKYYSNAQGLDTVGLTELATRLVADASNRTHGLVTRLQSAPVTPWVHFKPGDRNVMVNLAPKRGREQLRCMAIVATKTRDDATPVYEAHWESVVYQGEAAVLEQVRRLVRKFDALRPAAAVFDGRPVPAAAAADLGVPLSRIEIVLAAYNTNADLLPFADFICDGVNDEETWAEAIEALNRIDGIDDIGGRGTIIILDGDYVFDNNLVLSTAACGGITFRGDGAPHVVLNYNTGGTDGVTALFNLYGGGAQSTHRTIRFHNIRFDGAGRSNSRWMYAWTLTTKPAIHVTECYFTNFLLNVWWSERTILLFFRDNNITSCALTGSAFHFDAGTAGWQLVHHNIFNSCSGTMVSGFSFSDHALFHGNVRMGGTITLDALGGVTYADNLGF